MSDDEFHRVTEIERVANGKPTHFAMDEAFCARMQAAIAGWKVRRLASSPCLGPKTLNTPRT